MVDMHGRKIEVVDMHAQRREFFFEPPHFIKHDLVTLINDPRDFPILCLLFNITVLTIPGALLVFVLDSNLFGFCFWLANLLLFQERFLLGLHYSSHKSLFRCNFLNTAVVALISPFFGLPCGLYHLHHVIMHHSENNLDGWDLSSTERYQRDDITHFLIYWMRFLCCIWFELPYYAFRKGRIGYAISSLAAIACFFTAVYALYASYPLATFWLLLFPIFINSFLLMFGNWSQHIFVDQNKPRSNYHLAYNVINDECNQRTFNDGYHIEHHANSRKHWSELPSSFLANLDLYAKEDAIVFQNLDPMKVGLLVFLGRYDILARHLVHFCYPPKNPAEIESFLRSRLVPIKCRP
jgi:fatty acid desaturase